MPRARRILEGSPVPLGAHWDGSGVNFALFSANATKVELCLFDASGRRELERVALPEYTHEVWHGYLPDVRPGQLYGYRVHGPYAPEAGHRFNPNKLLLDPYALELHGDIRWHDSVFGYRVGHPREDLSFDRRNSSFVMPKCVVVDPTFTWGNEVQPRHPWSNTIIYEAHVKGMSALNPEIPHRYQGTFEGLADPSTIEHLVKLGVSSIELLPIHAFYDDRHLVERGLVNYWGYNTIGFFSPAPRYISPGGNIDEFKLMVRRLHDANIEVILDVVYNHTAEGNQMGPTLSFRGIDNASYYVLGDDKRYYFDTTGCGNTMNLRNQRVLQMVMDSLRYWVTECRVDGFRFDLSSTLGRDRAEFDHDAVFFEAVRQDPVLSEVKLIAEPWDTGPDGYQLGNHPPGWAEWNDQYRDTVRGFWKGDEGMVQRLAPRLLGSSDIFDKRGRRPWASVNFVAAHDGFTLADVVSYDGKHNEANGEDNRDGHDHNLSHNWGVEGPTDDPAIVETRDRLRRAMMATVLFSQGTPMILMGDEIGRTQGGNNNGYCQDNEINWLRWEDRGERDEEFFEFVRRLIAIRQEHGLLRQNRFLHERTTPNGDPEICWLRPDGAQMESGDWENPGTRALMVMLNGEDESLLLLMNAHHEDVEFTLPERDGGWTLMVDTAHGVAESSGAGPAEANLQLPPRTLMLVEARNAHQ